MNLRLIKDWIKKHNPQGATKLCARAEISPATLTKIMNGRTQSPGVEIAIKVAVAMGVSLDELCGNRTSNNDYPPAA